MQLSHLCNYNVKLYLNNTYKLNTNIVLVRLKTHNTVYKRLIYLKHVDWPSRLIGQRANACWAPELCQNTCISFLAV